MLSKNFVEEEIILEKDDEGRMIVNIFDKKTSDDTEDAYEAEVENAEAMNDLNACHDFLAMMTKHFLKTNGQSRCNFQEKHKAACSLLGELREDYSHRKLKAYSLPIVSYLLFEEAVKEANDDTTTRLFVEAFKDLETLVNKVVLSCDKTDKMMEKHMIRKQDPNNDLRLLQVDDLDHEEVLNEVLLFVEQNEERKISSLVKLFKKEVTKKEVVGVAHTKLKDEKPWFGEES